MRGGLPNFLAISAPIPHISAIVAAGTVTGNQDYCDGLLFLSQAVSGEVSPEARLALPVPTGFEPAPARYPDLIARLHLDWFIVSPKH